MSLSNLDFLTRDQLQVIHKLGTTRNTNRVLHDLRLYLDNFREGYDTVYYLSSVGRQYTGAKKVRNRNQCVNHMLMRNQYFLHANMPDDWENEIGITDGTDKIIPDVKYIANNRIHFLEVDNTQSMSENRKKIETYRRMFFRGHLTKKFRYFPPVIWLTTSDFRKGELSAAVKGLPGTVLTIKDIK